MEFKRKIYTISIIVIFILSLFFIYKDDINSKNNEMLNNEITTKKEIDSDNIYFFSHIGCPFCDQALKYINKKYGNSIKMEIVVIDKGGNNYNLFIKASEKYNLNKRKLGTPLIAMGDNYIFGWGKDGEKKFDEYVKNFLKNE